MYISTFNCFKYSGDLKSGKNFKKQPCMTNTTNIKTENKNSLKRKNLTQIKGTI